MPEARARIMVVEDEGLVGAEIREALQGLGYAVPVVASSGEEALAKLTETEPDLVLMDIQLKSDPDGIATARRMRALLDVPVVYLTAFSDTETLEEAKHTEPYGYILKPFDERSLHATIQMALYRHSRTRGLLEGERWASAVAANMSDPVVICDPKGLVTFVNPAAETLFGRQRSEMVGERIAEALTVVDAETGGALVLPVSEPLAEGRSVLRGNCRAMSTGGAETPVEVSASPLRGAEGALFGILYVFRRTAERERLHALVLRELEGLARIARRAAPPRDSVVAGLRLDRLVHPAELSGGDLVGFADLGGGFVGFWGVDMIGQGVDAALSSLLVSAALSTDTDRGGMLVETRCEEPRRRIRSPSEAVSLLGKRFAPSEPGDPLFTIVYGVVDSQRGGGVRLVRAGHPHPLLVREDGQVRWSKPEGYAIGLFPSSPMATDELRLDRGSRLLVYSDGLVDATNPAGERFGTARLAEVARAHRGSPLREMVDAVDAAVASWRAGQARGAGEAAAAVTFEDDVSLLVLERAAES
jgi:PAS domain S-box-containing protein